MFTRYWQDQPRLIRFLISNFADGVVIGSAFVLVILQTDMGGLGALADRADSLWPTAILLLSGGWLFGGLAMSVAVVTVEVERD